MTDRITAAARAICRERCAYMGEPACWTAEGEWPPSGEVGCAEPNCVDLARAALSAEADGWRPIDENTPLDQDVMIGWWQTWPERKWHQRYEWAGASNKHGNGYSNAWMHGQATHYFVPTFPAPPSEPTDA